MKFAVLIIAVMSGAICASLPAIAQNAEKNNITSPSTSGEMEASGQPFVHPSSDVSYDKDMRDDEMLAKSKPADNGKVRYISGGIALSGMRAIDAEEALYNLKLLFVSKEEYLSDVSVNITDSEGNGVLNTTAKGSVLLVKMPPGRYMVNTSVRGAWTLTRRIDVPAAHLATYVLRYPAENQ